jgi:hypothetical protein
VVSRPEARGGDGAGGRLALVESAMAPPDPDFVARIRTIAEASARKAAALANLDEEPGSWWRLQKGPTPSSSPTSYGPQPTAPDLPSCGDDSTAPSSISEKLGWCERMPAIRGDGMLVWLTPSGARWCWPG